MRLKLFFLVTLHVSLIAKTKPVKGHIIDEDSNALEDVSIMSLPSMTNTKSDKQGLFSFLVPVRDRKLVISMQGYQSDTLSVILFKNKTYIVLKEYVIDDPIDNINKFIQFVVSRRDKNIIYYPLENFYVDGYGGLKHILFENTAVNFNNSLYGLESISIRGIKQNAMDILYDGIKFDGMKNPLIGMSVIPELALSDLVITKGGHYKLTASQGAINFIPNISYDNKFLFRINQAHVEANSFINGYGSLSYKNGNLNLGRSTKELALTYQDTSSPEIFNHIDRNSYNIAYTNSKNIDVRFMGFDSFKNFTNQRTFETSYDSLRNVIIKLNQWSPLAGLVNIFALYQRNNDFSSFNNDTITNNNQMAGVGLSIEKDFGNSVYTFSTITNYSKINYTFNSDSILADRQNSIFSGSVKYFFTKKEKIVYFKDLSFVFTKERTTDMRNVDSPYALKTNYWDNNNFQLRGGLKSAKFKNIQLLYLNLGNVNRTPSVDEVLNNRMRITSNDNKISPENNNILSSGIAYAGGREDNSNGYQIEFSHFIYNYSNKIKRIFISNTGLTYPYNIGNISVSGYELYVKYQPRYSWIYFESMISSQSTPNLKLLSFQPGLIGKIHTHFKNKYFNVLIMLSQESEKYFTMKNNNGMLEDVQLIPSNYINAVIYKNFNYKTFNFSVNLLGENLQTKKLIVNQINIYNTKYSLGVNISIL